jgi:hypothetical protein
MRCDDRHDDYIDNATENKMQKFTLTQLQEVMIGLRSHSDENSFAAWRMVFDEVHRRMGDDAFDKWCTSIGI